MAYLGAGEGEPLRPGNAPRTSRAGAGEEWGPHRRVVAAVCVVAAVLGLVVVSASVQSSAAVEGAGWTTGLNAASHAGGSHGLRFEQAEGHTKDCFASDFTKVTLKLVRESNFVSVMYKYAEVEGVTEVDHAAILDKFEASDIISSPDGNHHYVVFDNSFKIGKIDRGVWNPSNPEADEKVQNGLLEWPVAMTHEDSQFEAIAYNETSNSYLIVEETRERDNGALLALVHEIAIKDSEIHHIRHCDIAHKFSSENKGIEGAAVLYVGSRSFLLGLCEGNFCEGGKEGRTPGNGRIFVLEREIAADGACVYAKRHVIELPKSVAFLDYSALTIRGSRLAITSQENSAVWVTSASFDADSGTVVLEEGQIYDFPRNDFCEIKYCNVEGVHFESDEVLVVVSDAMKGRANQPFICREKAQAVHIFSIPQ